MLWPGSAYCGGGTCWISRRLCEGKVTKKSHKKVTGSRSNMRCCLFQLSVGTTTLNHQRVGATLVMVRMPAAPEISSRG